MAGLEKIHPEFFDFYVTRFISRLRRLKRKMEVRLVYQVREPQSSIASFIDYQSRNPRWYSRLSKEDVLRHYVKTYRSIRDCHIEMPGLTVDYSELREDLPAALVKIWRHTWPEVYADPAHLRSLVSLARAAAEATRREKRATSQPLFLGPETGPSSGSQERYAELFSRQKGVLEDCKRYYLEILRRV